MVPVVSTDACHICLEDIGDSKFRPLTKGVSEKLKYLTGNSRKGYLTALLFSRTPKIHVTCKGKLEGLAKKKADKEGHTWRIRKDGRLKWPAPFVVLSNPNDVHSIEKQKSAWQEARKGKKDYNKKLTIKCEEGGKKMRRKRPRSQSTDRACTVRSRKRVRKSITPRDDGKRAPRESNPVIVIEAAKNAPGCFPGTKRSRRWCEDEDSLRDFGLLDAAGVLCLLRHGSF